MNAAPERIEHWLRDATRPDASQIEREIALGIVQNYYRRLFVELQQAKDRIAALERNLAARPRLELLSKDGP
ncbi:MAG: hypothetical protein ACRD4T_00085 [Candidatus Acidiferrales bacterium]